MNIAIISGASRGIGLEISKLLDLEALDGLWLICGKNSPNYEFKTKFRIFYTDLSKANPYTEIVEALKSFLPCVKFLVCSAGIGYNGSLSDISLENIENTVMVNCSALSTLTKISSEYMQNGSKIIHIASGAGFLPQPYFATYAASKSYVISFSRAIGRELSKKGISVTAVCPGPVDTDFFANLNNVAEYKKKHLISANMVARSAIRASKKKKKICSPTLSMKLVHLASKIVPTSLILKFYK